MDPLTGLLDSPRARDAFVLRMVMSTPWGVRVEDRAPLTVITVVAGDAWITPDGGDPRHVGPGDIALVRGPDPYCIGDEMASPFEIVVHPGQRCVDRAGRSLEEPFMRGVRTWGNDADGGNVMIVGTYERLGEPGRHLLDVLPSVLVADRDAIGSPIVDLLSAEMSRDVPGQGAVLDRLLDVVAVGVLRHWFDSEGGDVPGWWQAARDPIIGPAVSVLLHNPDHAWTVQSLAEHVAMSRAAFARRFAELVGQSPIAFLTEWRLALAADLLLEPGATVQSVAQSVGYGTGFALSAAFSRVRGISPTAHRSNHVA